MIAPRTEPMTIPTNAPIVSPQHYSKGLWLVSGFLIIEVYTLNGQGSIGSGLEQFGIVHLTELGLKF
jgi:hypothetical protein